MKNLILSLLILLPVFAVKAQGPIRRNPVTTNEFMNTASSGDVPIWNATAGMWSNGVFSATVTNLPGYAITNEWAGPTFTNKVALRQEGNAEFLGDLISTNGDITILQDGFTLLIGPNRFDGSASVTSYAGWTQRGGLIFDIAGTSIDMQSNSFIRVRQDGLLQLDSGSRLELDYLTANRVMITGSGSMATNHPDMRLATSLSGAADGEALKYHAASGTWTNATDSGSAAAAGGSGAIQVAQGTAFRGTNDPGTQQFTYNFTNGFMTILLSSSGQLEIWPNRLVEISSTPLYFGTAGITNWNITGQGHFHPTGSNTYDFGGYTSPARTNYAQYLRAKQGVQIDGNPGTQSALDLYSTNGSNKVTIQGANQITVNVTNIWGLYEVATTSPLAIDANQQHEVNITNRLTGNIVIVLTNTARGQELSGTILGAAAGGSDHTVQFVVHSGQLAANGYVPGSALATSITMTVTNGHSLEWNNKVVNQLSTNFNKFQFAYYTN